MVSSGVGSQRSYRGGLPHSRGLSCSREEPGSLTAPLSYLSQGENPEYRNSCMHKGVHHRVAYTSGNTQIEPYALSGNNQTGPQDLRFNTEKSNVDLVSRRQPQYLI